MPSFQGFLNLKVCGFLLFLILGLLMKIYQAVKKQCHDHWEPRPVENSTQPVELRKLPLETFRDELEYNNTILGSRKQATENDEYYECGKC